MAEPTFDLAQRQALLRYRDLRNADIAGRVGATAGNAGRIIQGKDPMYAYSAPGADNLTEAEKAELRAKYADILAKLAQAEREATSSDQDFQGVLAQSNASVIKAILEYGGASLSATSGVAQEKVQAYEKFGQAAIDQEVGARESQRLSPEGKTAVLAVAEQAQKGGVVNPLDVMVSIEKDMRALYEKNPAQIPAYKENVERALRATGRPELAEFSVESMLATGLQGIDTSGVMADSLNRMLSEGYAAQSSARALEEDGVKRREEALDALIRQNPYAPKEIRDLATTFSSYLTASPGAERAYLTAPPADATADEKRLYVEKASGGTHTVGENLRVVPKAQPDQDGVSYSAFAQANPRVEEVPRGLGGTGPAQPSGFSQGRSGPTEDTIKSIRALRDQISTQLSNLDKVNPSPLAQARAEAQQALVGSEAFERAPEWATRAAVRTAKAEELRDIRGLRADRDEAILRGETAARLPEVGLAAVREVPRVLGRAALAGVGAGIQGVQNLIDRRAARRAEPAPEIASPPEADPAQAAATSEAFRAAQTAMLSGDKTTAFEQAARASTLAQTPAEMRTAAKVLRSLGYDVRADAVEGNADDLEYSATQTAREQRPADTLDLTIPTPRRPTRAQLQEAQTTFETDPTVRTDPSFQPVVPGRAPTTVPTSAYRSPGGRTLQEARAEEPQRYGDVGRLIGDLGTTNRINEAYSEPDQVRFERAPIATPPPRTPDAQVLTGESSAEQPGKNTAQNIGAILQQPEAPAAAPVVAPQFDTRDVGFWRQFKTRADALPTGDVATSPTAPETRGVDFAGGGTIEPQYETPTLRSLRKQKQAEAR